jgi:hypothetical protein
VNMGLASFLGRVGILLGPDGICSCSNQQWGKLPVSHRIIAICTFAWELTERRVAPSSKPAGGNVRTDGRQSVA